MTNLLLDVEPRDPAPRCPHCAALEARVADLEAQLASVRFKTVLDAALAEAWPIGDLTDAAPERTEVSL